MTRTVEEIETDIKAAAAERRLIDERMSVLRSEKDAAILASSGLLGHVVSYRRRGAETKFLVEGVSRWGGASLRGRMIKKDGSLGVKEVEASASTLTDHGLYVAQERSK